MRIEGSVALVTGANRGLGKELVMALLERGAAKVYGAARDPASVASPGATPVRLDVTDADSVREAAQLATDVDLLINNAGISTRTGLLTGELDNIRLEMETNYFGPLGVSRTFAPTLGGNGGGGILNVLSVLSWFSWPASAAYCAAKAAAWSMTNSLRQELVGQGTQVTALHVSYMETGMARGVQGPKAAPADVATQALDGVEAGAFEVLADDVTRRVREGLSADITVLYPALATEAG
jgi:NAD(P)-dependent dehydrogenase (short-subunit alcohol dehydrogenase family)